MQRRNLLSFIPAIAACAALPLELRASAEMESCTPLRYERESDHIIRVSGKSSDVIAFMYRWQDALWANWRSDEKLVAGYRDHEDRLRKNPMASLSFSMMVKEEYIAFVEAIR